MSTTSDVTVTDQFCGAGGSSRGAQAAGATIKLAMNHWRLAIETHNTNFPDADHCCADISTTDPRRFPSTTVLITSPECINHSQAKSHRPAMDDMKPSLFDKVAAEERSRATMWDVPRFAEYHRYKLIVVENVVEAHNWVQFPAWVLAMGLLGYTGRAVFMNSMTAPPTPQSRDRMYWVWWHKGVRAPDLDWTVPSICAEHGPVDAVQVWRTPTSAWPAAQWGKLGAQYDYRCPTCDAKAKVDAQPAWTAIDWTMPGQRIGDRATKLKPSTMARIARGVAKYGRSPVVVPLSYVGDDRKQARPTWEPFATQTGRAEHGLAHPFLHQFAGNAFEREHSSCRSRDVRDPLRTQTGTASEGLVMVPFVAELRGGGSGERPVTEHLATVCANGNHHLLVQGCYVKNYGTERHATQMVKPFDQALGAVTTQDHHGLVQVPLIDTFFGHGQPARPVTEPLGTCTTTDRHALVDPGAGVPDVDDCYYRMLAPHEIQRAMGFTDDYQVLGDQRSKVRQLGNAVTPPAMEKILDRCLAVL